MKYRICLFFLICFLLGCIEEGEDKIASVPESCVVFKPLADTEIIKGERVSLEAHISNETEGEEVLVQFFIDDLGFEIIDQPPYISYWFTSSFDTGFYTVKTVASNEAGECSDSVEIHLVEKFPLSDFKVSDTKIEEGQSVQFTDLSSRQPKEWLWDFGDGLTSVSQNPQHTYTYAGNYPVSLNVKNEFGENKIIKIINVSHVNGAASGYIKDIEGNTYKIKRFGAKWWMVENMVSSTLRDGTVLPRIQVDSVWKETHEAAYWPTDDSSGFYYKGYYEIHTKICPMGWHIPEIEEWDYLDQIISNMKDDFAYINLFEVPWKGYISENGKLWNNNSAYFLSNFNVNNSRRWIISENGSKVGWGIMSFDEGVFVRCVRDSEVK